MCDLLSNCLPMLQIRVSISSRQLEILFLGKLPEKAGERGEAEILFQSRNIVEFRGFGTALCLFVSNALCVRLLPSWRNVNLMLSLKERAQGVFRVCQWRK